MLYSDSNKNTGQRSCRDTLVSELLVCYGLVPGSRLSSKPCAGYNRNQDGGVLLCVGVQQ